METTVGILDTSEEKIEDETSPVDMPQVSSRVLSSDAPAIVEPVAATHTGTHIGTHIGTHAHSVISRPPAKPPLKKPISVDRPSTLAKEASAVSTISLDDLRLFFHLPIAEVAKQFGTCTTALKKACRRLNISKWPYRQILSLTKSIQSLEMASLNEFLSEELKAQYRDQITVLQRAIREVMKNPNKPIEALNFSSIPSASEAIAAEVEDEDEHDAQPDPHVQHVIKAAAAAISSAAPSSSCAKKPKNKRKADGTEAGGAEEGAEKDREKESASSSSSANGLRLPVPPSLQSFLASSLAVDVARGELDNGSVGPLLQIGATQVRHNPNYENPKYQFYAPVQLAPLQRKKMRPNPQQKIVPLMEPDVGSNFLIEFIPHLIVSKPTTDRLNALPNNPSAFPTNNNHNFS